MRTKFANVAKSGNAHFVSAIYATCAGLTTGQWFARETKNAVSFEAANSRQTTVH